MATTTRSTERIPIEKRRTTRTVYIGLRQWRNAKAVHCPGLTIRAFDFTPQEVHDIIVRALQAAALNYQRRRRVRKMLDGEGT